MRSPLPAVYRGFLADGRGRMGIFVFSMRCPNCGTDSINWVVCSECGHRLSGRSGLHWSAVLLYVVLVIIFLPIGLCGGAVVVGSLMPKSAYDSTFAGLALMIAIPSLIMGIVVVYFSLKAIFGRGKD